MIENLKMHYKEALITAESPFKTDVYSWFLTEAETFFGIKKDHLSEKETSLLSSLFTPYGTHLNDMTDTQAFWYNLLFLQQGSLSPDQFSFSECRFIQFYADQPITDRLEFQEAIQALLPRDTIFLWESDSSGVLIETINEEMAEDVFYDEITVTLTSDFYTDMRLFIGQTHPLSENLGSLFHTEREWFQKGIHFLHKQKVYQLHDILPILLLEDMNADFRNQLKNVIPVELQADRELLETLKVYFESDLNVSNAAKRLYMHRNSLQYRIEKFIEKSGIDIKHFHGAVTTYLAILDLEHFPDS
ncbi:PucR family transcriptional regulator [Bacillus sp. REN16]|uniref:PucR family transcriptional regulator n=1 Tax=Bacillus sp. REN16 TaxID=2887296 RepID=UPI001E329E5A|nr:helix-turn-helix domain-containing protein [Bacillus sp. REN16]MCC3355402.1 helix-turn-helix domain-containing protein [Bacillus sp. REN16]